MSPRGRALALLLLAVGCGSGRPGDPVAGAVRAGVMIQLGVVPTQVVCAHDRCAVDVAVAVDGQSTRLVATVIGEREVTWQTEEVVLAVPLAAHVTAQLADLGLEAEVDCGPPVRPVPADGRVACRVGDEGVAWVRLGPAGQVEVEVELPPEVIAARDTPADDQALERASRALDTDEAEGSDDDDDDDRDGGVDGGETDAAPARGIGG